MADETNSPAAGSPLSGTQETPISKSPIIKEEPMGDADQQPWVNNRETINLVSDDDEDDQPVMTTRPTLGSPFGGNSNDPKQTNGTSEGTNGRAGSIPAAETWENMTIEKMLEMQKKLAIQFREQHPDKVPPRASANSPDNDETNEMPSTPPSKARGASAKAKKVDDDAAKFAKIKQAYFKKKKLGTLSITEEINFIKREAEESARLRKKQADDDFERTPSADEDSGNEGLFMESETAPHYSAMFSPDGDEEPKKSSKKRGRRAKKDPNEGEDDGQPQKKQRATKSKGNAGKKTKKVLGTKYTEDDVQEVLKQARQSKSKAQKGKGTGRKKAEGPTITNTTSVFGSNIFADRAAVADMPDQPGFDVEKGPRSDAFKQLIASVPEESRKIANVDKRFLDEAIKAFTGAGSIRPSTDGGWIQKGLRSTLKHYQVLGVGFMRQREVQEHQPRGGILADEMGLGKTVMMLSNILNGRAKEKSRGPRATLIVAAPALVAQWDREIRTHCFSHRENKQHGIGRVIQYHAGSRIKSPDLHEMLEGADIVLTTYHEVAKSYPKAVVPSNLVTAAQKDAWWKEFYEQERGILHRIKWLRVVLDEAQAIKNHKGHTSMACRALDSKHNWAITGTPILNTISEFYPYFKYLKEPHTGSLKIFKENFCSSSANDPEGIERLNVFLRKFMIRRTHLDFLFGARLLNLPEPRESTLWLEFNDVERNIYEIVKNRFIQRINTMAKTADEQGLQRSYHSIWVMILRLRQICSHPLLVQSTIVDLLEREDLEKLNSITQTEDEMTDEGQAILLHLREALKRNAGVSSVQPGSFGTSTLIETEGNPNAFLDIDNEGDTGGKHGLSIRYRKYLEDLMKSENWNTICARTLCASCRQPPLEPMVTSCYHIYCTSCLNDLQHMVARQGHDSAKCKKCGEYYSYTAPCEGLDTFRAPRPSTSSSDPSQARKLTKESSKQLSSWVDMPGDQVASSKTQGCKAQILNWLEESPDEKIIIYTQFLPMVKILSRMCAAEGWKFEKYTGEMSHEAREKAITEFEKPEKKILLASLRCGGLGLNLTMASKVICLDPWWNAAVEQQAFCRVFRIVSPILPQNVDMRLTSFKGQTRETSMTRFVIRNTIDEAMMSMKERKQVEIDEVMNDAKRKEKLSVTDLMRLFGPVGEDEQRRPFIFASDTVEADHLRLANDDQDDEERFMQNSP